MTKIIIRRVGTRDWQNKAVSFYNISDAEDYIVQEIKNTKDRITADRMIAEIKQCASLKEICYVASGALHTYSREFV